MKQLLKSPVLSEKSLAMSENGKYVFKVNAAANKKGVKELVEKLFKVKVVDVHIINLPGKLKTFRRTKGKRSDIKKAVVTLKKGDKIDLFEGANK